MSKIRIKNFGPIKEGYQDNDGWIDIEKVTVFIGNQGSGKSTVAKVISTLTWLEKALNRGDEEKGTISTKKFKEYFKYQRINNYFRNDTEIEYEGDIFTIKYNTSLDLLNTKLNEDTNYRVPKIMYVPAERNFLSVIKNPYSIKTMPDTLRTFAEELREIQLVIKDKKIPLPIGKISYKYDTENDASFIIGENFELDLSESSSGYQSLIPLYLVTKFLSEELNEGENRLRYRLSIEQTVRMQLEYNVLIAQTMSEKQKDETLQKLKAKYLSTCFINIVEEPEQNLFPSSQKEMLFSLLKYNNANNANKLIMTTHSPYLINILSIAIQAGVVKGKASTKSESIINRIGNIIPLESIIHAKDVAIYQLDESLGSISKLGDYEGIPSDKNFLNQFLAEGNRLFDALLEIEEEL